MLTPTATGGGSTPRGIPGADLDSFYANAESSEEESSEEEESEEESEEDIEDEEDSGDGEDEDEDGEEVPEDGNESAEEEKEEDRKESDDELPPRLQVPGSSLPAPPLPASATTAQTEGEGVWGSSPQ